MVFKIFSDLYNNLQKNRDYEKRKCAEDMVREACSTCDTEKCKQAIKDYPNINVNRYYADGYGHTMFKPLPHAAVNDCNEIFKILIRHPNVDVNEQDKFGNTSLHYLSSDINYGGNGLPTNDIDILLKNKNIDFTIKNNDGKTALDIAYKNSYHHAGTYAFYKQVQKAYEDQL